MIKKIFASKGKSLRLAIRSMREHLNPQHKKKLAVLSILIFASAILDIFGLASILPVINAATSPSIIHTNFILNFLFTELHFENNRFFLLFLISSLLIFFILKSVFGLFVTFVQAKLSSEIAVFLSKNEFSKYFSIHYFDFQKLHSSEVSKDIVYNPNSYVQWIVLTLITFISEVVMVALIIGAIAIFNIKLFIFIIITVGPATYLISTFIRRRSGEIGVGIDISYPKAYGAVNEALNGYIDIKLADKEKFYRDKYLTHQHRYQWLMMKQYFMNQVPFRTNEVIALLGIMVIFVYALFISNKDNELITLIGLFAAASYRLMPSVNRIINSINYLNINQVSIHNLNYFVGHYLKEQKIDARQVPVAFNHHLKFNQVSFSFPDSLKPVLNKISFEINKGEKVGFVGSSGSGKTTLMNILLRFYIENGGEILCDNVKLVRENLTDWRKKIGYVKQDIFLLDGTIKNNIAFGEDTIDEERLKTVIRQASLYEFVSSLPEGADTYIGEKGSRLSGGQKQRIGIARSLYRNADILIFDEATSALDNETEKEVTESIDMLSGANKTILIIAHRITTLRNCDRIYQLKDGEIGGVYTYQELIEKVN